MKMIVGILSCLAIAVNAEESLRDKYAVLFKRNIFSKQKYVAAGSQNAEESSADKTLLLCGVVDHNGSVGVYITGVENSAKSSYAKGDTIEDMTISAVTPHEIVLRRDKALITWPVGCNLVLNGTEWSVAEVSVAAVPAVSKAKGFSRWTHARTSKKRTRKYSKRKR